MLKVTAISTRKCQKIFPELFEENLDPLNFQYEFLTIGRRSVLCDSCILCTKNNQKFFQRKTKKQRKIQKKHGIRIHGNATL